jgi:hypothetical protein
VTKGDHLILILACNWSHYVDKNFVFQKYGNQFPENDRLYQEKSILIIYSRDYIANIIRSMWIKSVLQFASNHSQYYVFIIIEQQMNSASVQVFQASFADWYLFIQDRIFNVPRWVVITSY